MKPETVNNVLRHLKGIVAALEKERKEMLEVPEHITEKVKITPQ